MPFARPTLAALVTRARGDLASELPGDDPTLRRSPERALAKVLAGQAHGLHGHLAYNARQLIPDTAEDAVMARWASIWGLEKKPAEKAEGEATITGTDTTVCPSDTLWERNDGVRFVQVGDATISGSSATASLIAEVAGTDGNTDAAATLSIVSPVSGIDSTATVTAGGLVGGLDVEEDADLLARLLSRLRTPPKGGGPGDYVNWALEVTGVTRAWELPLQLGEGTVVVLFVRDNDVSLIPDSGEVSAVQDYIDSVRPVTASVTVMAPTAVTLDLTIAVTPDTAAVRAAVEAELEDFLLREGEPGVTLSLSRISEAISSASGETSHVLTVPAADVTHGATEIPVLGTITWV